MVAEVVVLLVVALGLLRVLLELLTVLVGLLLCAKQNPDKPRNKTAVIRMRDFFI